MTSRKVESYSRYNLENFQKSENPKLKHLNVLKRCSSSILDQIDFNLFEFLTLWIAWKEAENRRSFRGESGLRGAELND